MKKEVKYDFVRKELLKWYKENKRDYPWRKSKSLFRILITEILLQKTIASNVNNIYSDFFTKYRNFSAINKTEITKLQSDIKELGLSNKRAQILKDLSDLVINLFGSYYVNKFAIVRANMSGFRKFQNNKASLGFKFLQLLILYQVLSRTG